ncbi:MAG: response regulator [Flavobacteriales bacterium]|nr:response regulator [Flavobacteriales bacterium]
MAKKRILIVEDEAIVAKDISVCLIRTGYEVIGTFSNGEQALEFLKTDKPDLILMDIMLAGKLTGIETTVIIKEKYDIPVVFLTAYADEKTIEKAKVTEPYGYIIKPFKEIDLRTSIEMASYKFLKEKEKFSKLTHKGLEKDSIIAKEYIYVKSNSRLVKVDNNKIIFIEALKDYVILHTLTEKFTIHSTMKDIEKKLPDEYFIRVHRSFIINLKKISSIDSSFVMLEDYKKAILIGGSYKENLFNRLNMA